MRTPGGVTVKVMTTSADYAAWFKRRMRALYPVNEPVPLEIDAMLERLGRRESEAWSPATRNGSEPIKR